MHNNMSFKKSNGRNNGGRNSSAATSQPKSLPCKKMICTGVCTYRNRCHYIHDTRIMSSYAKGTCRKKNKDESLDQKDLFFWTPMTTTPGKEARIYSVPPVSSASDAATEIGGGGGAVASLWHHFVEVCVASSANQNGPILVGARSANTINPVTLQPRLPVFVNLSTCEDDVSLDLEHQHAQTSLSPSVTSNGPASFSPSCPKKRRNCVDVELLKSSSSVSPLTGQRFQPFCNEESAMQSKMMLDKYMPIIKDIMKTDQHFSGGFNSSSSGYCYNNAPPNKQRQYDQLSPAARSPTTVVSHLSLWDEVDEDKMF